MKRESKKLEVVEPEAADFWDEAGYHVRKPHFESSVPWLDGMTEFESINAAAGTLIVGSREAVKIAKNNDALAGMRIGMKMRSFKETGNAVYLLEAFLLSRDLGVYPPDAVLNWLAEAFGNFHQESGVDRNKKALNMSKMLGLAPGRGQENVFQPLLRDELWDVIMLSMARLKIHYELSAQDAADLEEARLHATKGWNKSKFGIQAPCASEMVKKYSKSRKSYEGIINEHGMPPTNEELKAIIDMYPRAAVNRLSPEGRKTLKNYFK